MKQRISAVMGAYDYAGRLSLLRKFVVRHCPRHSNIKTSYACDGKILRESGKDIGRCGYYKDGKCTHPEHPDVYAKDR